MNALSALTKLRALRVDTIRTSDAAAALDMTMAAANKLLLRLAAAGHAQRLTHGLFGSRSAHRIAIAYPRS